MVEAAVYIGIDVAKAQLDLAIHASDHVWRVANDADGIAATVCRLGEPGAGEDRAGSHRRL